jgi:hypothetical protein
VLLGEVMQDEKPTGVRYELWDYESRNLLADFPSKAEVLAMVRDVVRQHGRAYVTAWALGRTDDAGLDEPLLEGPALADEALKPASA